MSIFHIFLSPRVVLSPLVYTEAISPADFGGLDLNQIGLLSCDLSSFPVSCFETRPSEETGDDFYAATITLRTSIRGFMMKLEVLFRGIIVATTVMEEIHRPFTGKGCA